MATATPAVMRDWARQQPHLAPRVGQRGRLHPTIIAAFQKAHPSSEQVAARPSRGAQKPAREPITEARMVTIPTPPRLDAAPPAYDKKVHKYICGFCSVGNCERCPESVKGSSDTSPATHCRHALQGHPPKAA